VGAPGRSAAARPQPAGFRVSGAGGAAWHSLSADAALARLDAGPAGLSGAEAERRLARSGPNRLLALPPEPAWRILLRQLRSVIVVLLVAAGALSLALGDPLDTAAIGVVLVINTVLGFAMELRARRSMEALVEMEVPRARVVRDGRTREVPASNLVPGDVIRVEAGQTVPADARLLRAAELQTSEAALTGESLPVAKDAEAVLPEDAPLAERRNLLHKGTSVVRGAGTALVVATGMRTEVGHIGSLVSGIREEPTPLERRLDDLGRRLVWVALGAGAAVAVLGFLRGGSAGVVLETAVVLAIAAVPEGLPVVATIALAVGVRRMARRRALVRRLASVETLGSVTTVCSDKTGTLTAGEMTVTVVEAGGRAYRVTGTGYAPEGAFLDGEREVRPGPADPLFLALRTAVLANRAELSRSADGWSVHGDPTEGALLAAGPKAGVERRALLRELPEEGEVPFSSDRMLMATFHRGPDGELLALVKGAPGRVLERCDRVAGEDGVRPLGDAERRALAERNEALAARGLRVLGLAYRPGVPRADERELEGLVFAGLVGMADPPAPGVLETIARLRGAGLRTVMITGDQAATAAAVAGELGLLGPGAESLEGGELDRLSDEELAARASRVGVYSRVSPEAKLRITAALRGSGEIVAMLGDGVNDAPALRRADIGVAMGGRGTDAAREAADIVLQDDRFATVGAAVEEGRVVFDNIRKFVLYLFSCNLAEVLVVVGAGAAGLPLPLLPLQILWMNLVTDTFPALALAAEPPEDDVMRRPPRDPRAAVLSAGFIRLVAFYGALMTVVTLAAFVWALERGDPARAVTVTFMTLSLTQIFHLGNARSARAVLRFRAATSNRFALSAVALTVSLQLLALTLPPLRSVLGLVPLEWRDWAVVLPLALAPAAVGQALKAARRPRAAPGAPWD
jgi:Ca2+-transporting ATPase